MASNYIWLLKNVISWNGIYVFNNVICDRVKNTKTLEVILKRNSVYIY